MTSFEPNSSNQSSEFVFKTPISGLLYIKHKNFVDERGFYVELSRVPEIETELGFSFAIKQLNLSFSKQNVARGFHAEDWNKLLTVTRGTVFGVWADIRPDSSTFGQTVSMEVGKDNGTPWGSMFVSSGIANSFCTISKDVDYLYAVDQLYADRDISGDIAISLFDQDLAVEWPIAKNDMIISERDLSAMSLRERFPDKFK